jgi:N-acyl-L-homoserine lactone synthetase
MPSNQSCIASLERLFTVSLARTEEEIAEAQRLRYQVYCTERNFLPGCDGYETDDYDDRSVHVILRRRSGQMVGTVRLVTGLAEQPERSFPMQAVCRPGLLSELALPILQMGEVSRFAISRVRRDGDSRIDLLLRLALMRGLLEASTAAGVTYWCAVMEKSLFRLLRQASVHFIPVGEPIRYKGVRQAAVAEIADVLARSRIERAELWNYVTDGGRLAGAEFGFRASGIPQAYTASAIAA